MKKDFRKTKKVLSILLVIMLILSAMPLQVLATIGYEITYDANGATSGAVPIDNNSYWYVNATVMGNTGNLQKTGYVFDGWVREKKGPDEYYSAGDQIFMNWDKTLKAVWKELEPFRVKNTNGPGTTGIGGDHGYIKVTYNGTTVNLDAGETHTFYYVDTAGDVELDFVPDAGWSFKHYVIGNGAQHINDDPDYIDPSTYAGENGANNMIQVNPKWDMTTYTVTWNNWDGTQLEQDTDVPYMDTPSYDGSTPTRPATAEFTYTFSGWSPTISPVTGNITYTAQYDATKNKYTVTWNNYDNSQLEQDLNVPYGDTPMYNGATPTKPATAEFTYTFNGWSPTVSAVTGDITYTAQFTETTNKYTVTWMKDTQQLEQDVNVPYGTQPDYNGLLAGSYSTPEFTFTFVGWNTDPNATTGVADTALPTVTGDVTYYAIYSKVTNKYTVTWMKESTQLEQDVDVSYGTQPDYNGLLAGSYVTAEATYTFAGWSADPNATSGVADTALPTVTGDVTYYAIYTKVINEYTVKWKSLGVLLEKDENVPYGDMPSYDGATPVKPADAQYTYTFSHWNPTVSPVTGDIVYRAKFSKTLNEYTVTWEDEDGTQLEQDLNVPYGDMPSFDSATPTKPADAQYTYTFAGWTPVVDTVTGDVTYTATYSETLNEYTVTWEDEDGTQLEQDLNVPYGDTPSFDSATPTKAATAQYTYTFAGWTPTVSTVTGDATYTATYTETLNDYTVTWNNFNGVQLEQDLNVPYGDTPTYDGATPTQPATAQFTYTFAGWTPTVSAVTGDVIYTAQFTQTTNTYPVTFVNFNGVTLGTDTVPYGGAATAPGVPGRTGYTFTGWDVPFNNITGPLTVTAQFAINSYPYTVNYVDANGDPIADPTTTTAVYQTTVTVTPVEVEGYTPRLDSQDITIATTGNEATFIYDEDEVVVPPEVIEEPETPLAGPSWALLNLILAIATAVMSIVLLVTYFSKKEKDQEIKRKGFWRVFSIVPAALAIITFILTEDMTAPMVFTDKWTLLMAAYTLLGAVVMVMATKKEQNAQTS